MKYLFIGGLSCVLAGMFWSCSTRNTLDLALGGQTEYAIIQGANATPAEKFAAQELSAFLEKATGAKYTILSETNRPLSQKGIYVGWTDVAGRCVDLSKLGEEEWIIKTQDKNLILAGGRPRGTLYAVYDFLEQQVKFHWLDEFTEVTPSKPELKLKQLDVRAQPLFWNRSIYSAWNYIGTDMQKVILFEVRNKDTAAPGAKCGFGIGVGSPGGCHTFYAYSKDWPTNRPEYLAMNARGQRVVSKDGGGPGQICLTHPEVRKLMLVKLRQYIALDRANAAKTGAPYPRVYDVSQNDTHWTCQCPACKALTEREEAESGPLIDLVNSLADGIKDEYPDVLVQTFAYSNVLKPPKTIRPRDNVMIRIAQLNAEYAGDALGGKYRSPDFYPDMFHPMTHAINRGACELLTNWSRIAKHLAYWDYWRFYSCAGNFATPYANLACIRSDLELFLDNKVETIFVEMEEVFPTMFNHVSFFSLKRWLGLKLLQNPRQDMEPLIQTFMAGYYGPAAGKMREYLDYMERRVAEVPGTNKMSAMKAHERPYLDSEFFITSVRLLDEAEALCGTNKMALLHVRKERIPVDAALYCLWTPLQAKLPAGKTLPFDREVVLRRYESTCLEQMNAFYGTNKHAAIKGALEEQLEKFREIPLIEKRKTDITCPKLRVLGLKENAAGDLTRIDWTQAAVIEKWQDCLTGLERPERKLSGRLAHDDRFLYLQLVEETDASKLKPELWTGDNWELFFAAEYGKAPYNQIAVTPSGKYVAYGWPAVGNSPGTWDSSATIKSDTEGGGWKVSLAFPLAKLVPGGVKPGQKLYANFFRSTPAPGTHMAWSPAFEKNFHLLDRLGEVSLE